MAFAVIVGHKARAPCSAEITALARRPAQYPPDTWPPRMMAELAAGYVGEKHVEDFLQRVGKEYPQPRVTDSKRRRFWYRHDLDRAMGVVDSPTGMGARFDPKNRKKRGDRPSVKELDRELEGFERKHGY